MNTGKTPRVHIGEREAVRYGKAGYKINDAGGTACLFGESGRKTIPDRQIYQWMHEKLASSFDDMTNLSKVLRQKLQDACEYVSLERYGCRFRRSMEPASTCSASRTAMSSRVS